MTETSNITIKRAYDPPAAADGVRILVDRLWPRGLRKETANLAFWFKDLAPSSELRRWFDHKPERFDAFKLKYRAELAGNPAVPEALAQIGNRHATLLYGARDPHINHAVILAEFLRDARKDR